MRARMTADEVNKHISENTGIDFEELSNLFIESVKVMKVDNRLLDLAKTLLSKGRKVALVTNFSDTLLIDDSSTMRATFEKRGGAIFPFETFESFEPWLNKNLLSTTG
ncbi:MAG: hypothetical protein GF347_03700 [Candidatus Moranbacteria bacterium]|nr:hypothetical protein [Candidatus Moranbacteria bacterium]